MGQVFKLFIHLIDDNNNTTTRNDNSTIKYDKLKRELS